MLEFLESAFFWGMAFLLFLATLLFRLFFPTCLCFFWLLLATILFIVSDHQYYAGRDFPEARSTTVRGIIADYDYHRYYTRNRISDKYYEGAVYYYDANGNKYSIELPSTSRGSYRFSSDAIVVYDIDNPEKARIVSLDGKTQYIYTQTGEGVGLWAKLCLFLALIALFEIYWREAGKLDEKKHKLHKGKVIKRKKTAKHKKF
ncbi:hypothetical protein ACSRCJ_23660 [Salmonella enterica]